MSSEYRCNRSMTLILAAVVVNYCASVLVAADSLPNDAVMSDEARLIKTLTQRYEKIGKVARPVVNSSSPVKIRLSLMLYKLINVDESEQFITLILWIHLIWNDELLVWNPEDYGGIRSVHILPSFIWIPDIELYNSIDYNSPLLDRNRYLATVNHQGQVHWVPAAKIRSGCQIDMRRFPFDEQRCNITLAPWSLDNSLLDLDFDGREDIDLSSFIESNEWNLVESSAWRKMVRYSCSHVGMTEFVEFTHLVHSMTIRRCVGFYVYALIIPSVLLSFFMPLTFWIPTTGDGRITLGMSLFSSFFLLLLVLIEASPTSASVSNLGIYFCCNMVLIAVINVVSAVIVHISHYYQDKPVPPWARKVFIDVLSRVFLSCDSIAPRDGAVGLKQSSRDDQLTDTTPGESSSNQCDWRVLTHVLDRLCFTLSVTAVVAAIVIFFPR